jgi:transposase
MNGKKQYDAAFKKQTIEYMLEENKTLSQVAREIGVSVSSIAQWRDKYHPNPSQLVTKADLSEKQQLREAKKRILDLEEENEILKKAAAIFAKNPR